MYTHTFDMYMSRHVTCTYVTQVSKRDTFLKDSLDQTLISLTIPPFCTRYYLHVHVASIDFPVQNGGTTNN